MGSEMCIRDRHHYYLQCVVLVYVETSDHVLTITKQHQLRFTSTQTQFDFLQVFTLLAPYFEQIQHLDSHSDFGLFVHTAIDSSEGTRPDLMIDVVLVNLCIGYTVARILIVDVFEV